MIHDGSPTCRLLVQEERGLDTWMMNQVTLCLGNFPLHYNTCMSLLRLFCLGAGSHWVLPFVFYCQFCIAVIIPPLFATILNFLALITHTVILFFYLPIKFYHVIFVLLPLPWLPLCTALYQLLGGFDRLNSPMSARKQVGSLITKICSRYKWFLSLLRRRFLFHCTNSSTRCKLYFSGSIKVYSIFHQKKKKLYHVIFVTKK